MSCAFKKASYMYFLKVFKGKWRISIEGDVNFNGLVCTMDKMEFEESLRIVMATIFRTCFHPRIVGISL